MLTLKGKNDIIEVGDKECDNELSKLIYYFNNALEKYPMKTIIFNLATLTYEVDGFNNSPSFKEFQRVIN